MENSEQLKKELLNIIQTIKMLSDQASKKKFSDDFLIMIKNEIKILNIEQMASNYEFSNQIKNDYFNKFFNNFYLFENAKDHILYKLNNIFEIKLFHENQIIKYFDDEFGKFSNKSFLYIFSQIIKKIKKKNNDDNFIEDFTKLESKWWIYYMQYTGQYNKLKKIIIQRILNNNILTENNYNPNLIHYNMFLKYLNKYSIENSKIAKLLFITLKDGKNKVEWFNLFSNLDIKDFKKYNKIIESTKEKALEVIDKFLNLNPKIKLSSKEIYSIVSDPEIGHLFLMNQIIIYENNVNNTNVDTSFFNYIIYLLKYNNQEKHIFKFISDFYNYIMNDIDTKEMPELKELKKTIIKNMEHKTYEKNFSKANNIFDTWKFIFPSLPVSEDIYNKVVDNNNREQEAINYILTDFDNDVNEFCKRNIKLYCNESNLKSIFRLDENKFLNKKGHIFDFIIIFLELRKEKKLSSSKDSKEIDGVLSYFVTKFEFIFENEYQVIKTNYSLLNKSKIIEDINFLLDDKYKIKNIGEVSDDIWKTFIEYDLLSLHDIKEWSKYEEKGDKLYAIIINKLIVKGNLREAKDKSIYESSVFQDKILQKLNIKKHLVKSDILWKKNYKNADYLEYLLFALQQNYSFEVSESFLINLLKNANEFVETKKREIATIIRVPLLCVREKLEEYYERPYYQSFEFHIRLLHSIKDFYLVGSEERENIDIPYWWQISEENENEIFEILTFFFEEKFALFDKYFKNKFRKIE